MNGSFSGTTLRNLPKSAVFTSHLPADDAFPTPKDSHNALRDELGPRLVKGALFTYVRPEGTEDPELLCVSKAALGDIGISSDEARSEEFKQAVAGNLVIAYDSEKHEGIYPWAQCYGGYQFGQWAGQLGDGRAISLFEATHPKTSKRYELQLKGAGKTPYSRFADGKAVLRSSIREFVVSESLHALGIPTTRALSLVLAPKTHVARERLEPGAVVCRFAETWLRIGTFDLLRARGDRKLLRRLADYVAENVFNGWESLPTKIASADGKDFKASEDVREASDTAKSARGLPTTVSEIAEDLAELGIESGIKKDTIQGTGAHAENRYARLYREICRRNAKTVALWQAYGFTNGVLNTDNTSVFGLSIDFGPFAFIDNFDPSYTPNHDDHSLRYSYRNQPTIIWWNLVRLGEAFGELMGAGSWCDDEEFVAKGVRKERADELVERAETLIETAGEEFKALFMQEYKRAMTARLGLKQFKQADFDQLFSEWLDTLEALELDFNQSFRKLASVNMSEIESAGGREDKAKVFFRTDREQRGSSDEAAGLKRLANWLEAWRSRILEDWGEGNDEERRGAMNKVNPKVRHTRRRSRIR